MFFNYNAKVQSIFYYANILEKNFNKKLILDLNQLIILFLFLRRKFLLIKKLFLFMRIHYIIKILFKNFDLIISILQKFGAIIGVLVKS